MLFVIPQPTYSNEVEINYLQLHAIFPFDTNNTLFEKPAYDNVKISGGFSPIFKFNPENKDIVAHRITELEQNITGKSTHVFDSWYNRTPLYFRVQSTYLYETEEFIYFQFELYPDLLVMSSEITSNKPIDNLTLKKELNDFIYAAGKVESKILNNLSIKPIARRYGYPNFIIYISCPACTTNTRDLNRNFYLDYFQMKEFIKFKNNRDTLLFHPNIYHFRQNNMVVGSEFVDTVLPLIEFYYITRPYSSQEMNGLKSSVDSISLNLTKISDDLKISKKLEDVNNAINELDQLDSVITSYERKLLSLRSLRTVEGELLEEGPPYLGISKFERNGNATYGEKIKKHYNKLSNGLLDLEVSIDAVKERQGRYYGRAFTQDNSYQQQKNFQSQIDKINTQIKLTQFALVFTLVALVLTIGALLATIIFNRQQIRIMNQQLDVMREQLGLSKKVFKRKNKKEN